jgi:hypothetical protein
MVKKRAKTEKIVIDRKLGVKVGRKTYYPLPKGHAGVDANPAENMGLARVAGPAHLGPCTGKPDGTPCPGGVCIDHDCYGSRETVRALGFALSPVTG